MRYRLVRGRWPDLARPVEFDEKLLWLMLYWRHPAKTWIGEKAGMREYAGALGLQGLLPELYGIWERAAEVPWGELPGRAMVKCGHGCHYNLFPFERTPGGIRRAGKQLERWLAKDYSRSSGEVHYRGMRRRILAEEFLEQGGGKSLVDYKVYCFEGKAHCVLVCSEREPNGNALYDFYDAAWTRRLSYSRGSLAADRRIPRPEGLERMVAAAERLSRPFPFVRVDFYCLGSRVVLGEMTFTPTGCINPDYTEEAQQVLGGLLRLPPEVGEGPVWDEEAGRRWVSEWAGERGSRAGTSSGIRSGALVGRAMLSEVY